MTDKMYYLSLCVIVGCSVAITWRYFQVTDEDARVPNGEEMLAAIREGTENATRAALDVQAKTAKASDN